MIVALFVPHAGCPQQCVFCNQSSISGELRRLTAQDVHDAVNKALQANPATAAEGEIAFFGGSFTAIDPSYRRELLEAAHGYIKHGAFAGIRISTRPDAIDGQRCAELAQYGVTTVELGAQSMDERVLASCRRGHSAADVEQASHMLKQHGFALGLQMMTGLPGSGDGDALETARRLIRLKPDMVRIYPTLVLKGTPLAALYESGSYQPQGLDEAVALCARLLELFRLAAIPVIRLGLHAGEELRRGYLAGPWHPAFRELCESRLYLRQARELLQTQCAGGGEATLLVSPQAISKMTGQKRENLQVLGREGYTVRVRADAALQDYEIRLEDNTWY